MKLISAEALFTEAKQYLEGRTISGEPHPKDLNKAEKLLHEILDNNIGNPIVLYVIGSLYAEKGNNGLAIQILSHVTQTNPKFGEAWNNLGLAYRGINAWDKAAVCAKQAMKYLTHADIPCNLSGLYLNRNMPEESLKYADEALKRDPEHVKAKWHKALSLLEMRRWGEAWDWHEARLENGANSEIANRNYHGPDGQTLQWDGKTPGLVAIHGEQGMGDEIMFASCLKDAIATGADIVLEPSPRMEKLLQRSFPEIKVFGTNDTAGERWVGDIGKPDFKCAIGSLPKFFRRTPESFPGTPFLVPDKNLQAWWSDKLKAFGPRPRIGIAWQGGVHATRQDARSFHPLMLEPLFRHQATWVSLQYDSTARENIEDVRRELGVRIAHWPKAVEQYDPETKEPTDLDDLAALISRLDLVISVCQTAIHFAGALGVPCWCLTPSEPSWRYGAGEATDMPWYRSVSLIRQAKGSNDWGPVIEEAADRLGKFLSERKSA